MFIPDLLGALTRGGGRIAVTVGFQLREGSISGGSFFRLEGTL